ncbi:hypothetical protein HWV62_18838 [Athelia sp. TMB]|nr:hypothetical protein HWV62_18838 [Athelia sp. TMB]
MSFLSALVTPGFKSGVYAGNFLWHASAFVHFTFLPAKMFRKLTIARTVGDELHHDVMRYLGAINASSAVLAIVRLFQLRAFVRRGRLGTQGDRDLDVLAFTALGVANLSQFCMNVFWARTSGRWIIGRGLDRITVLDTVFSVLDFGSLALVLAGH